MKLQKEQSEMRSKNLKKFREFREMLIKKKKLERELKASPQEDEILNIQKQINILKKMIHLNT